VSDDLNDSLLREARALAELRGSVNGFISGVLVTLFIGGLILIMVWPKR